MESPPWKKNIESVLVVYTILAAIAGILISFVLSDSSYYSKYWWIIVLPLSLSLFLFIYSSEQITDALDEDDVNKLLYSYCLYDVAVILLFWGVVSTIYFRYFTIWPLTFCTNFLSLLASIVIFVFFTYHWWRHLKWLILSDENEYQSYILELKGEITPEFDHRWHFKLFMWIRKKLVKKNLSIEFKEFRIELKPSPINGIGVFAAKDFNIGDFIAEGIHEEDYFELIPWSTVKELDDSIKDKISSFCVGTPAGFIPPEDLDFNALSVEWFMNHSCDGNVGFNEEGDFIAIKIIKQGEELTYDYGLAESNPDFIMNCDCKNNNCRKVITGNDWKNDNFKHQHLLFMLPRLRK